MRKRFTHNEAEREQRLQTDTQDEVFETPEIALWYNVISQAVSDSLKLESKNKYNRIDAIDAIAWLLHDQRDYEIVCCRADVDPVVLRRLLWPWLHERFPFALREGRIVSPTTKLKRKIEEKRRL